MQQQISDSELALMKMIWAKGGMALYAPILFSKDHDTIQKFWREKYK